MVLGVMFGGAMALLSWTRHLDGPASALLSLWGMVALCTLVILAARHGLKRVHTRFTAGMHALQREVAVTIARETARQRLAEKRGGPSN